MRVQAKLHAHAKIFVHSRAHTLKISGREVRPKQVWLYLSRRLSVLVSECFALPCCTRACDQSGPEAQGQSFVTGRPTPTAPQQSACVR